MASEGQPEARSQKPEARSQKPERICLRVKPTQQKTELRDGGARSPEDTAVSRYLDPAVPKAVTLKCQLWKPINFSFLLEPV